MPGNDFPDNNSTPSFQARKKAWRIRVLDAEWSIILKNFFHPGNVLSLAFITLLIGIGMQGSAMLGVISQATIAVIAPYLLVTASVFVVAFFALGAFWAIYRLFNEYWKAVADLKAVEETLKTSLGTQTSQGTFFLFFQEVALNPQKNTNYDYDLDPETQLKFFLPPHALTADAQKETIAIEILGNPENTKKSSGMPYNKLAVLSPIDFENFTVQGIVPSTPQIDKQTLIVTVSDNNVTVAWYSPHEKIGKKTLTEEDSRSITQDLYPKNWQTNNIKDKAATEKLLINKILLACRPKIDPIYGMILLQYANKAYFDKLLRDKNLSNMAILTTLKGKEFENKNILLQFLNEQHRFDINSFQNRDESYELFPQLAISIKRGFRPFTHLKNTIKAWINVPRHIIQLSVGIGLLLVTGILVGCYFAGAAPFLAPVVTTFISFFDAAFTGLGLGGVAAFGIYHAVATALAIIALAFGPENLIGTLARTGRIIYNFAEGLVAEPAPDLPPPSNPQTTPSLTSPALTANNSNPVLATQTPTLLPPTTSYTLPPPPAL